MDAYKAALSSAILVDAFMITVNVTASSVRVISTIHAITEANKDAVILLLTPFKVNVSTASTHLGVTVESVDPIITITPSLPPSLPPSVSQNPKNNPSIVPIILGVVLVMMVVMMLAAILWYSCRRYKTAKSLPTSTNGQQIKDPVVFDVTNTLVPSLVQCTINPLNARPVK